MEIYSDFNQLIYAIRSIEMYAPWVRHIYIVTNGQIPYWLNLNQSYVSVVTHQQIFKNKVLSGISTSVRRLRHWESESESKVTESES